MKKLLLLALCSVSSYEVLAKDSDWRICKGDVVLYGENVKLVVNAYEHRNGKGRAADLTFIYGGNVLRGSLDTSDTTSGLVSLKGTNSSFKGSTSVDYQNSTLNLVGKVTLNRTVSDLNATLDCEPLQN